MGNSIPACNEILNMTGEPGEWLMVVQWHTPNRWHRWLRTDVRKYVEMDDAAMSLSYFLVGGFGSWLPRLAFRERIIGAGDGAASPTLRVEVWYEIDDQYIGWPTDSLHNLTRERWTLFYRGVKGYAETVEKLATDQQAPLSSGKGVIQREFDAWLLLKMLGG